MCFAENNRLMRNCNHARVPKKKKMAGHLYRPANDPQIGPQMIPEPEIIPANDTAKSRNGVDS